MPVELLASPWRKWGRTPRPGRGLHYHDLFFITLRYGEVPAGGDPDIDWSRNWRRFRTTLVEVGYRPHTDGPSLLMPMRGGLVKWEFDRGYHFVAIEELRSPGITTRRPAMNALLQAAHGDSVTYSPGTRTGTRVWFKRPKDLA